MIAALLLCFFGTALCFSGSEIAQPQHLDGIPIRHRRVQVATSPVFLHCAEAGIRSPLYDNVILLLHGFPDFWYTWKSQIPFLVRAEYFVVAPDLRGYGASDKPLGIEEYAAAPVTGDIEALRRHCGGGQADDASPFALLAGHDWGAAIVWATLQRNPSLPWAPELFLESPLASWALMTELEAAVAAGSSKEAERAQSRRGGGEKTTDEPRPPHLSLEDHKWYDAAIRTKGAVRGGLSYYRASAAGLWPGFLPNWVPAFGLEALRWLHRATASSSISSSITPPLAPPLPPPSEPSDHHNSVIEIPVLVLWGELDRYLGRELAFPPRDLVPNVQGPVFLDGTHWVHLSQPHEVNAQLIKFLSASGKLEGSDRDCETGA